MMDVRPIRTDADHEWALAQVTRYFERTPDPGTADGDRFEVLLELVAAYEARLIPMPQLDPVDALRAFMESTGRSQADFADLIGSRSRASEILARKRALTVGMIYRLHRDWGVPAELLVTPHARAA